MTKILTEEELRKLEREFWVDTDFGSGHFPSLEYLFVSHRALLSANAELSYKNQKLTEENNNALTKEDILYTLSSITDMFEENTSMLAENEKLRKALTDVWEVDTSDWEEAVRKQYSIIETALEELK
jgi:hypothetical protein